MIRLDHLTICVSDCIDATAFTPSTTRCPDTNSQAGLKTRLYDLRAPIVDLRAPIVPLVEAGL